MRSVIATLASPKRPTPKVTASKTAADSMQYKPTPPAGFESQTGIPKQAPVEGSTPRDDATPVANMSLQFRVTPPAGFTSQADMPAQATGPRGASQGMEMKAVKRRPVALLVGIGVVVIAATIAIVVLVIAFHGFTAA